jgi:hypothetical protein
MLPHYFLTSLSRAASGCRAKVDRSAVEAIKHVTDISN